MSPHGLAIRVLVLAYGLALGVSLFASRAACSPGASCEHTSQCSRAHGEVCLADSPTSSSGHCARIRVLP